MTSAQQRSSQQGADASTLGALHDTTQELSAAQAEAVAACVAINEASCDLSLVEVCVPRSAVSMLMIALVHRL